MNMGPKQSQMIFIEEIRNSSSMYIIKGGTYINIGNIKGRNELELTPNHRFPYINNFINQNYDEFKNINKWKIFKKK